MERPLYHYTMTPFSYSGVRYSDGYSTFIFSKSLIYIFFLLKLLILAWNRHSIVFGLKSLPALDYFSGVRIHQVVTATLVFDKHCASALFNHSLLDRIRLFFLHWITIFHTELQFFCINWRFSASLLNAVRVFLHFPDLFISINNFRFFDSFFFGRQFFVRRRRFARRRRFGFHIFFRLTFCDVFVFLCDAESHSLSNWKKTIYAIGITIKVFSGNLNTLNPDSSENRPRL